MATREEIREGILQRYACRGKLLSAEEFTDSLLSYLHSQDVVIKVGEISENLAWAASESPKYFARGKDIALVSTERTFHTFKEFKDMGYVAVIPLIGEDE